MAFVSDVIKRSAVAAYQCGLYSMPELASHFGCTSRSITRWAREAGVRGQEVTSAKNRAERPALPDLLNLQIRACRVRPSRPLPPGRFATPAAASADLLACLRQDGRPWGLRVVARWAADAGLTEAEARLHLDALVSTFLVHRTSDPGILQWTARPAPQVPPARRPSATPRAPVPVAPAAPAPSRDAAPPSGTRLRGRAGRAA